MRSNPKSSLAPVLGGEGRGVRGRTKQKTLPLSPLTPTPLPRITGGEGLSRGILASAVVLGLLLSVPARAAAPKSIVVPFELLKTKHIAIKVKINGKGPYRMIFDTGAPFTLLSTKAARDSGVINKNTKKPLFTLFGSMGALKIKTFEVGGARIDNTSAAVMDHPTIEAISQLLGRIEGLVGFPFFARYKMTIDYKAKTMTLVPNGFKPDDSKEAVEAAMTSMLKGGPAERIEAPAALWGFVATKDEDDDDAGVTISRIYPGSAAAAAGLKKGDRLLTLAGRWTDSVADTAHAGSYIKPGTKAKLVIERDKKEMTLTLTPRSGL